MANNGSSTFYVTNYDSIRFSWESLGQSAAGNYTTIKWKLELVSVTNGKIVSSSIKSWAVTVDGTRYSGKNTIGIGDNSVITLALGTSDVRHNADGTKSFNYSFEQEFGITFGGKKIGTVSGTGVGNLNTIARKSMLAVGGGMLGESQQLTVTQIDSAFTHTITYKCGSLSGTIATKSTQTKIMWTPPVDLATQAPSANSVAVTLTITTYNGSTAVGSNSETISCSIPHTNTFVPVLMPSVSDATGNYDKFGGFVQGQSKLKVEIETYGAYGAWITSVRTIFDGATYNGTNVVSNAITQSGDIPVVITVTDSRGRTSESRTTINVLAYSLPKVTKLTATRCNQDGTTNPKGSFMLVKFGAKISGLNGKNTAKYYVGYKKSSESEHSAVELTNLANQYTVDSSYVIPADPNYSHTVICTALDAFGQARAVITGPSVKQVWSLMKKNGEIVGIAFNKVAEHEGYFDIGMPVKFSGGGDTVVEQGEMNGWTYRKWDSGMAECWKTLTHRTAITTSWGALYHGTATSRQSYPFSFVDKPTEQVSLTAGSYQAILFPEKEGNGVNGASASACYNVCRPSSLASTMEFYISFYVVGKWK